MIERGWGTGGGASCELRGARWRASCDETRDTRGGKFGYDLRDVMELGWPRGRRARRIGCETGDGRLETGEFRGRGELRMFMAKGCGIANSSGCCVNVDVGI